MKLYPPIYPGESILHPGKFPGGDVDGAWSAAAIRSIFVRSNTVVREESEGVFDVLGVEQQARAARNAWIASQLKSYFAALMHKRERAAKTA